MEVAKKPPESSLAAVASFLSEVRLETSPTAVGFSDSCPCCGNKKRRCLQPSSFRKKVLVLDSTDPQSDSDAVISPHSNTTAAAAASASHSLTPPPSPLSRSNPMTAPSILSPAISPFRYLCSDPTSPMSPRTPSTPSPPDVAAARTSTPEKMPEWSNSILPAACAEEKTEDEEEGTAAEEVRVCVRCRCGIVRIIALVR